MTAMRRRTIVSAFVRQMRPTQKLEERPAQHEREVRRIPEQVKLSLDSDE
jgi:hypothetical protein